MNQFADKYKTLKTSDLLTIIENHKNYQALAVEAAKNEVESRQLSDKDLSDAKTELQNHQIEIENKSETKKAVINKIKTTIYSMADSINPIQNTSPNSEKIIRFITITFFGYSLFLLYSKFDMLRFMFSDLGFEWDISVVLDFLPLIVIPSFTYIFWSRKKIGWSLITILVTYSLASSVSLFIMTIIQSPSTQQGFNGLFSTPSPFTQLFTILFFIGILLIVSKENIRNIYGISKKSMQLTIGITIAFVGGLILTYFLL